MAAGLMATAFVCAADDSATVGQREYQASAASVKAALQALGATKGSRLPALEGFAKTEGLPIERFERPYYDFKVEVVSGAAGKTLLKVKATISAWYAEPGAEGGYRILESNGRLEGDLLDRVGDYLKKNPPSAADAQNLEQQIAETRKQREETERRVAELEAQIKAGAASGHGADDAADAHKEEFVGAAAGNIAILSAPQLHAAVLLTAEPDDEFQVIEHRGSYLKVKVDDARSGWILRSQARPATTNDLGAPSVASGEAASFNIVKQGVSTFEGDWLPLKGKKALYLWARPAGSPLNHSPANHLLFAESAFDERYREAAHNSQNALDGVVVIFLDQGGGVAAATFADVKLWRDGNLTKAAFLKRCSFDPHSEFADDTAAPRHQAAAARRKTGVQ